MSAVGPDCVKTQKPTES